MSRLRSLASLLLALAVVAGDAEARGGRGGSRGHGGGHGRSRGAGHGHGHGHGHGFGRGGGRSMGFTHGGHGRSHAMGSYVLSRSYAHGRYHWHGYTTGVHRHGYARRPYGLRGPRYGRGVYGHGFYVVGRGTRYLWVPGAWCWRSDRYAWVPGVWARPPASGLVWLPGHWVWREGAWGWEPAAWVPEPEGATRDEPPSEANAAAQEPGAARDANRDDLDEPDELDELDEGGPTWGPPVAPPLVHEVVPPPPDFGASEADDDARHAR
jgi:hypothetical protein